MKKRRRNTARRMSELPRSDPSGSAAAIAGPGVPEMSVFAYTEDALEEKHGIPVDEIPAYRDFPGTPMGSRPITCHIRPHRVG